jgi:hypothetical protein
MSLPYIPSAAYALASGFSGFSGVAFNDPGAVAYAAPDPDRVDSRFFLAPIQSELLNLIRVALANGGALQVYNATGSTLNAGPVNVSGYFADASITGNPIFKVQAADVTGSKWANAILLSSLSNNSGGIAYAAGDYTSNALNTSGAAVGDPVYLKAGGGETLTATAQVVGRVKTIANPGQIAGLIATSIGVSGLSGFSGQSATGGVTFQAAYKSADTTKNNTSVLTADPDLHFTIGANEVWTLETYLIFNSSTNTPGLAVSFTGPASPTLVNINGERVTSNNSTFDGQVHGGGKAITSFGTQYDFAGIISGETERLKGIIINGANSGTITLTWAQVTATAENTTLKQGSFIIASKIG